MKVIVKQQRAPGWLTYEELLIGEVYYTNGSPDGDPEAEIDGALYLMTDDGGLVDIVNATVYRKDYATGAMRKWVFKQADIELVEYTNVSD